MSNNKIAVIGFGYWGKNHARVLNELGVLSGIYDSDMPHSEENIYHRFSSLEELLQVIRWLRLLLQKLKKLS
mgnify:CR=1 FL=1